jgi:hypothetical protein
MQESKWSHDEKWLGDPKLIAREIKVQLAEHDEKQVDILPVLEMSRNTLHRRFRGKPKWRRWELASLAKRWGIAVEDLTGESSANGASVGDSP